MTGCIAVALLTPLVSNTVMRRFGIPLALAVVVVSTAIYLSPRGSSPSGSTPTVFGINLAAQQSPTFEGAKRHWTTTRRIALACEARPSTKGSTSESGRALCDAVAYYSDDVPKPCVHFSFLARFYRRVVITGSIDGQQVHLEMGAVCNPPPALSRAVQTIYIAAFR